jgi:hypothetical protein
LIDRSSPADAHQPSSNPLTCTGALKIVRLERPEDLHEQLAKAIQAELTEAQVDALLKVLEDYVNRGLRAARVPEVGGLRRRLNKLARLTDQLARLLIEIEQKGEGDWYALTRVIGHQELSTYCVGTGLIKQVAYKTESDLVAVDRRAWASFEGLVHQLADIFEQTGRRATAQCTETFPPTPFVRLIELLLEQIPTDLRNPGRQVRLRPDAIGKLTQKILYERAEAECQRKQSEKESEATSLGI